MKKILVTIVTVALFGCTDGTQTQKPVITPPPISPLIVQGTIQNWQAGQSRDFNLTASLIILQRSTTSFTLGKIRNLQAVTVGSDGKYTRTFPTITDLEPALKSAQDQFDCESGSVTVTPADARAVWVFDRLSPGPWLMESTKPPVPPITSTAFGSDSIMYWFADKDSSIVGNCNFSRPVSIAFTYDVQLKAGWNRVVWTHPSVDSNLFSTSKTPVTSWYIIPGL